MPRYGIEYTKNETKYSRETTAKTQQEADAINERFNLKGEVNEIVKTEKTDIAK